MNLKKKTISSPVQMFGPQAVHDISIGTTVWLIQVGYKVPNLESPSADLETTVLMNVQENIVTGSQRIHLEKTMYQLCSWA